MNNNINFLAFGTFGNPNGFRQTVIGGNSMLSKNIKTFDLNTNAIKLFPSSKVYSLRKEFINNQKSISYSIYTYAKEQNSDRSGTFIGSSILYQDLIADELITIKILNDFHKELVNKNVISDVITVNHSDNFSIVRTIDIENIEFNFKKIGDLNFQTNSNIVVYTQTKEEILKKLFSDSLELLNIYDVIYFTDSPEVAKFSQQKKLFKVIPLDIFNKEIENFKSERKAKIINSINEFDNRIQELERDRKQMLHDFQLQKEKNIITHNENAKRIEEAENDLEKVLSFYNQFSVKIKELSNKLRSGKKLEEVSREFSEYKRIFINSVDQVKKPNFNISQIQKSKAKSNLQIDSIPVSRPINRNSYKQEKVSDVTKEYSNFKLLNKENLIIGFIVLVLIIAVYSLISYGNDDFDENNNDKNMYLEGDNSSIILNSEKNVSNDILSKNDYTIVAKNLKLNMTIDEVVSVIFELNPNEIKKHFSSQKKDYKIELFSKNKKCFDIKDGDTILNYSDTLRVIPILKTL